MADFTPAPSTRVTVDVDEMIRGVTVSYRRPLARTTRGAMRYKRGDWVRYQSGGQLHVAVVEYTRIAEWWPNKEEIITSAGHVLNADAVLEARTGPQEGR